MAEDAERSAPYVSYGTITNFFEALREHPLPTKIDKSLMPTLSYGTQAALLAALRSLGLIGTDNAPTPKLAKIVAADPKQRSPLMAELIRESYPFLFANGFDLKRATPAELDEKFKSDAHVSGSTVDKAVNFFIAAANDAGIGLSPHLAKRKPTSSNGAKRKRQKLRGRAESEEGSGEPPPPPPPPQDMTQQLLAKFPAFDPAWPDPLKTAWFAGFERLMKSTSKGRKDQSD